MLRWVAFWLVMLALVALDDSEGAWKVPMPDPMPRLAREPCPVPTNIPLPAGCALRDGSTIYYEDDLTVLAHELGHAYDFCCFTNEQGFRDLLGYGQDRPWIGDLEEQFAEAYERCWLGARSYPNYGFAPRKAALWRFCYRLRHNSI